MKITAMIRKTLPCLLGISLLAMTAAQASPLIYQPEANANGKKIVFIASDHEYRAEETCPALARILAKHYGFQTVVLFGLDEKGEIEAGASNIEGLEHLADADACVMFTRFQDLPDEQMAHIDAYLNRGGPILGLRTSTHGFAIPKGKTYVKYDYKYDGDDYKGGFGQQVLGQTWVGHYGKNHTQSTRIDIIPEKKDHVILTGVKDIHVQCGGYNAEAQEDWNILTMAQPLMTMLPDGAPDAKKPPMASEWTRTYKGKDGAEGRVFTSLYGASEDILNPGYRRMILNAIHWIAGMEDSIKPDSNIDFVGSYTPNTFRTGHHAKGIKPADYEGFTSPIPANDNTAPVKKKGK
ncbi:MAG: ThuA domain-containing protein [Akkermansiaceae bacterium]|jgi:type 1 glutamine amidotransferase|nr:ThuA domain-containing protein [Akkermansiaceae bacterium]MDP4647282.1 ThuA domain-containing protein [Akkermansiaceae bacterium]MDP4721557.1 ThuA domain-containing protein [Akkermansiaceae bacterium]MDP4781062.1 ThuA domain-containing protein [Akkermansiaceae bacterium]MDP4847498.1 ThuA domain-containing protein [Akkermansiaceae bacterium]